MATAFRRHALINSGILGAAAWQHGTLADDVDRLLADAEVFAPGYGQGWHSPFPLTVSSVLASYRESGESTLHNAQIGLALSARGDIGEFTIGPPVQPSMPTTMSRDNVGWLGRTVLWSELCERHGSVKDTTELFDTLAPFHAQVASGGSLWFGPVAAALGRLAVKLGRLDEAERYFAEADEINERIRAPFYLSRNRVAWARMLLARGDSERASGLLQSALEVARQYDCADVVEEAEQLLATASR